MLHATTEARQIRRQLTERFAWMEDFRECGNLGLDVGDPTPLSDIESAVHAAAYELRDWPRHMNFPDAAMQERWSHLYDLLMDGVLRSLIAERMAQKSKSRRKGWKGGNGSVVAG